MRIRSNFLRRLQAQKKPSAARPIAVAIQPARCPERKRVTKFKTVMAAREIRTALLLSLSAKRNNPRKILITKYEPKKSALEKVPLSLWGRLTPKNVATSSFCKTPAKLEIPLTKTVDLRSSNQSSLLLTVLANIQKKAKKCR